MYNSVDIICAAVLLVLGLFGYRTGAIASIFYLVSGFAGVLAAQKFSAALHVPFAVLFLAVTLGLIAFGIFSRAMARLFLLGFFDRLAGFGIGVVLGIFLLAVLLAPVSEKFSPSVKNKVHAAYVSKRLLPLVTAKLPGLKDVSETVCRTGGICK
jgi:uncharacterized membrane protein required for colicin V production